MAGTRFRGARMVNVLTGLALAASACGGGEDKAQTPNTTTDNSAVIPQTLDTTPDTQTKAAARWETVVTLTGTAAQTTAPFQILPGAIQWRARWKCTTGSLKVDTDPAPRRPGSLVDSTCPKEGEGFSITTGAVKLNVAATGTWDLIIDQQVDTPLNEAPLAAMASARVLGQGEFYDVEKNGKGSARLYQLGDGTRALRFENLEVNQNTDLFVWLGSAANPRTSKDAVSSDYWVLGNLKSTVGSQNYEVPSNIPIDRVRSIIIWCQPVAIAYAAAALSR
ncbi:MAG: DM13 domain-containing protein [Acidimicrobiales bacterium]